MQRRPYTENIEDRAYALLYHMENIFPQAVKAVGQIRSIPYPEASFVRIYSYLPAVDVSNLYEPATPDHIDPSLNAFPVSLDLCSDASVIFISNPSGKTKGDGNVLRCISESNTLDIAMEHKRYPDPFIDLMPCFHLDSLLSS